jgi:hypothetical protein
VQYIQGYIAHPLVRLSINIQKGSRLIERLDQCDRVGLELFASSMHMHPGMWTVRCSHEMLGNWTDGSKYSLPFFRTSHITLGAAGDISGAEVEDVGSGVVVSAMAIDGDPVEFCTASDSTRRWSTVQIRNERAATSSPCWSSRITSWPVRSLGISDALWVRGASWGGGAGVVVVHSVMKEVIVVTVDFGYCTDL